KDPARSYFHAKLLHRNQRWAGSAARRRGRTDVIVQNPAICRNHQAWQNRGTFAGLRSIRRTSSAEPEMDADPCRPAQKKTERDRKSVWVCRGPLRLQATVSGEFEDLVSPAREATRSRGTHGRTRRPKRLQAV